MNGLRILAVFTVLFAYGLPQVPALWAQEATAKTQVASPQRQMTGTGKTAGAAAGQTVGEKGFFGRGLILGALAVAALAAVALEVATDNDKVPGPGSTSTTTTTTTTSSTGG